jgi:hypothetical protein
LALDDYAANRTGLLLVDPYNDLLSDGGRLWPQAKAIAEAVDLLAHLPALVEAARAQVSWCSTSRTGGGVKAIMTDGVILALGRP